MYPSKEKHEENILIKDNLLCQLVQMKTYKESDLKKIESDLSCAKHTVDYLQKQIKMMKENIAFLDKIVKIREREVK